MPGKRLIGRRLHRRRPGWAWICARGPGGTRRRASRSSSVRITIQLPFLFVLAALACAARAGAAEYTVVICNGQSAATGGVFRLRVPTSRASRTSCGYSRPGERLRALTGRAAAA